MEKAYITFMSLHQFFEEFRRVHDMIFKMDLLDRKNEFFKRAFGTNTQDYLIFLN